ncbi:alpha/beta fold hydrolase [Paractinoplanes atraurantiacus]|uniref:DNA-binding transcriptional activator of the SARP family n=1 Tax=Paractinoplanes atraurantiacus TaxID=1036182 RepID=A0A285KKD6_9ACTN|nr:alpha/beta fold hydrolase [Actinoplanes atraurantiacus]SNY73078.1 DNA-binding transcriptional activator of the SARP family [Actinoplanes atraurantiacus]
MRFGVLGAVRAYAADGTPIPLGDRQRALLAALLARAGRTIAADRLAELIWGERLPADPAAALHSQVSRLRRALPEDTRLVTEPPGYVLRLAPGELDAARFDDLVARAARESPAGAASLLEEALRLWGGDAYAEVADSEIARLEAIRLGEARLHATEQWHRALLGAGRAAESLPGLEAFVAEHPLREHARDLLLRTLYALGRQAEALDSYRDYTERLAGELGLEPAAAIRETHLRVLRHDLPREVPSAPPLSRLRAVYVSVPGGGRSIATATLGEGPPLVALPGWVSALDVIASGRDPRSSLLQRLAGRCALTLFDRYGTGLSRGPVGDFGLEASVAELRAVVARLGVRANVLAMSEAGPLAVALAAAQPELVDRLVFVGTYADGPATFRRPELNAALVAMIRTHWGLGSKVFADLYRPGASDHAAQHLAEVLRDSADREVAAAYLEAAYEADVGDLLPKVTAPALVLHYRGDRVIPFDGGRQLAAGLPDARLIALEGRYHLPDAADLDRIVDEIAGFIGA